MRLLGYSEPEGILLYIPMFGNLNCLTATQDCSGRRQFGRCGGALGDEPDG